MSNTNTTFRVVSGDDGYIVERVEKVTTYTRVARYNTQTAAVHRCEQLRLNARKRDKVS